MLKKYFDYNSTTPVDPEVLDVFCNTARKYFGNPSSYHKEGFKSKDLFDECRIKISSLINATDDEVIFTSGATESNNMAIQGLIHYLYESRGSRKFHIICSTVEHDSVLKVLDKHLDKVDITFVSPNKYGIITSEAVKLFLNEDTKLIIVMYANHEIGSINEIESIGELCKKRNIYLHVDASQAFGKVRIDVKKLNISTMSASGHKIYAPKGIGLLYCSKNPRRIRLNSIYAGGDQQRGLKHGTIPIELCNSLTKASLLCHENMQSECSRLRNIQFKFNYEILSNLSHVKINGPLDFNRMSNNLNYSFYGVEGESILMMLSEYSISTGSACRSENLEPSKTIEEIAGLEFAHSSIRISFGKYTLLEDAIYFASDLIEVIKKLQSYSPMFV